MPSRSKPNERAFVLRRSQVRSSLRLVLVFLVPVGRRRLPGGGTLGLSALPTIARSRCSTNRLGIDVHQSIAGQAAFNRAVDLLRSQVPVIIGRVAPHP